MWANDALTMRASQLLILLLAILVIAASAWVFAPTGTLIVSVVMGWTLLTLAIVDWRTFTLPDPLTALLAALGLIMVWTTAREDWLHHLIGGVAGYLILLGVELFYRHVRGIDALGRGDAKLLGAIGLWVGWTRLPDLLLVAAATGLIAAIIASRLAHTRLTGEHAIAFGPWLALAAWICWLAGPLLVPAL